MLSFEFIFLSLLPADRVKLFFFDLIEDISNASGDLIERVEDRCKYDNSDSRTADNQVENSKKNDRLSTTVKDESILPCWWWWFLDKVRGLKKGEQ